MRAGLLFAIQDAEDRPDRLAATLPFAGTTLIEYQARLLIAAGATHLIVAVGRVPPELLGAVGRIARRVPAVDVVRSAAEAAARLHPLASVLVLADGLVTSEAAVRTVAESGPEVLIVADGSTAAEGLERLDSGSIWAGLALVTRERVAEVGALPRDYDFESALVRTAIQAGSTHRRLPVDLLGREHGAARRASLLEEHDREAIAAEAARRGTWFDRYVMGPLARLVGPGLLRRGVSTSAVVAAAGIMGLLAAAAILSGWRAGGLGGALVATIVAALGATLASLRDEGGARRAAATIGFALPAAAAMLVGVGELLAGDQGTLMALTGSGVVLATLGERWAPSTRDRYWGSPPIYLAALFAGVLVGAPLAGAMAAAAYAGAMAWLAGERLRRLVGA